MATASLLPTLVSLLAAPAIYYLCGLPWAVAAGRLHLAPLFGVAVFGLSAELGYIFAVDVAVVTVAVGALHAAAAVLATGRSASTAGAAKQDGGEFFACYLVALLPLAVAPFPLPGRWAGDWIIAMDTGYALFTGTPLPAVALTRPPLFAAAAAPLWCLGEKMVSFQIAAAVGSAACLQVVRHLLPTTHRSALLWTVAGSIFFLQNTAAAWSKLTAAAFLLAAWHAAGHRSTRPPYLAGALAGLALATHQATVLFVPLVVLRLFGASDDGRRSWRANLSALLMFGAVAAVVCFPWEIFTIVRYGLEAKATANPALSTRPDIPAWANTLLAGLTTLVAWGPAEAVLSLATENAARDAVFGARAVFWIATSSFNTAAGTLLLLLVPAWLALGSAPFLESARRIWRESDPPVRLAWGAAFAGHAVLIPYYSPDGSLQAGWVPAGLACLIWLSHRLAAQGAPAVRRALVWTLGPGLAAWTVFELGLGFALRHGAATHQRLRDTDLAYIREQALAPLGLSLFPWLQLALLGVTGVFLLRTFRTLRPH